MTANLCPIPIEPILVGDELRTDVEAIKKTLADPKYKGKVLCIICTTSCFAPRAIDSVVEVAKVCKEENIFHVINNAYGLQCTRITDDL